MQIIISGDESRNILFCACEHSVARGRFHLALDLEWTWLLCRSLSAHLNLRGGFVQIGLSVTAGFTSSNWSSLCVTTLRTIITGSMILSFAFFVLSLVIQFLLCSRRFQSWHLSCHTFLSLLPEIIAMRNVSYNRRSRKRNLDWAALFSMYIHGSEMVMVITMFLLSPSALLLVPL